MRARKPREEKDDVPQWMPSFSDMMTNLLCFFVLLVALADQREVGLVDTGIGSYMEKLESLGLPGIAPSTRTLIPADSPLARYTAPRIDPLERDNWVEHTESTLDEQFDRLNDAEATEAQSRDIPIPLGLRFSSRSDWLTMNDRKNLARLAPSLGRLDGTIQIRGTCLPSEGMKWPDDLGLSLKRSNAVFRYLTQNGVDPDLLVPVGAPQIESAPEGGDGPPRRKVELIWRRRLDPE